jgi:hypothetical protein
VLDGVEFPAATRSRRFGLKWRVAVAPSPAIAAFLHVETHVMCLCHALSGMRAPSTRSGASSKRVSRSRLESITSSRYSEYPQAVKAPALLRTPDQRAIPCLEPCRVSNGYEPSPPSPHYFYPLICTFRYLSGNRQFTSDARVSMHGFKTDSIVTSAVYPESYMFWAIGADNTS